MKASKELIQFFKRIRIIWLLGSWGRYFILEDKGILLIS
jgi:hypothetical protein